MGFKEGVKMIRSEFLKIGKYSFKADHGFRRWGEQTVAKIIAAVQIQTKVFWPVYAQDTEPKQS